MPENYVSDQNKDFPVTTCDAPLARVRYAFWRSAESILSNQPGKDFLAWHYEGTKLVFALCEGLSWSFPGQIATRFLGEKLIDWLWKLNLHKEESAEPIRAALKVQLKTWKKAGQRLVEKYTLPDNIPLSDRANLEELRKVLGSDTTFMCGQVNTQPGGSNEVAILWVGNPHLLIYDSNQQLLRTPYEGDGSSYWSTIQGLVGKIEVIKFTSSYTIGRIIAFSDGLSQACEQLISIEDQELQSFIGEGGGASTRGDISILDIRLKTDSKADRISDFPHKEKIEVAPEHTEDVPVKDIAIEIPLPQGMPEGILLNEPVEMVGQAGDLHPIEQVPPIEKVSLVEEPITGAMEPILKTDEPTKIEKIIIEENHPLQTEKDDSTEEGKIAPLEEMQMGETRPEETWPLDITRTRPVTHGTRSSKVWVSQQPIKININRGNQPGEYLLEWNALSGDYPYEVQASHNDQESITTQTGNKLLLQHPASGYHTYRVRAVTGREPAAWDTLENTVLYVPEPIVSSPENVRVRLNQNKTLSIQWEALKNKTVEEYRVYELVENVRKLVGTANEVNQCLINPGTLTGQLSFTVCAMNWTGEGPASKTVVFDPTPKKSIFDSLLSRSGSPRKPGEKLVVEKESKPEIFRCSTREQLCDEVTRRLKKSGVHMTGLRVEAKSEGSDEFRSIDHRKTTELISVYLEKGPEYRLIIYGSKGEQWSIPITFDRRTWHYLLAFGPIKKRNM